MLQINLILNMSINHMIYIYDDKSVDVFSFGIMVFEICSYNKRLEIPKYNTCQNRSGFYSVRSNKYNT